nr:immunoglobulin light chain junction region [Macaca mulatta]MOV34320.1 immunoglobulin light chain junction region [Macaca mulatta]MOV34322.1 immunoglobulin light chain junction region [Macaca mulatta]MOV34504.1 immunoglobulin light chain junction region [Macaca mulatta]MOV34575.1 immunoglobulin light chain junction region [Macaca mulatta]
CMQSVEFPFTF